MGRAATITTTDTYQEVSCPNTRRVTIQIFNAAIRIAFGKGVPPFYDDGEEETVAPSTATLIRRCDSIRLRSAITGLPALVFIKALDPTN